MDNQAITCMIDNGNIFKIDFSGNKVVIGVTADAYNNLKELSEKAVNRNEELAKEKDRYYQMLIENGILKKPKTMEELIAETQNQQADIVKTLNSLASTLDRLNTRMEVVENEITRPITNSSIIGDKPRQDTTSNENV